MNLLVQASSARVFTCPKAQSHVAVGLTEAAMSEAPASQACWWEILWFYDFFFFK